MMAQKSRKYRKEAAARARLARQVSPVYTIEVATVMVSGGTVLEPNNNDDDFECGYTGGVHHGLLQARRRGRCQAKCADEATDCCLKHILECQPDFVEQKPLVQEVIEAAGHLCIFLPKYHCELNFIECFWCAVKRYLRENCDYTFKTLKTNKLPKAMASVCLSTI